VSTRQWITRTIRQQRKNYEQTRYDAFKRAPSDDDEDDSTHRNPMKETCMYATGPAGCLTPARKLIHTATDMNERMKFKVRDTMIKTDQLLDRTLDHVIDWIGEEDDDDLFDVVVRITTKVGTQAYRVGKVVGRKSYRLVRQTIDSFIDSDADEDLWA